MDGCFGLAATRWRDDSVAFQGFVEIPILHSR
jgi:hypothetical protein